MNKKTILITGSRGFVGTNLVRKLKAQDKYKLIEFDIQDGDIASHEFEFSQIDHIIHLAGKTYVPDSWEDPYSFYRTNFLGTVNILDLCRKHKASLTYISSYVYGQPDYLPINEKHPLKAANPYMDSKIQADAVCRFYSSNFDVPTVIFRPFNIYGPGQSGNFLIPKIVHQVLSDSKEINVFSLNTKRDYIYIDDITDALIKSIDVNLGFQILNIGSGTSYSTKDIIDLCQSIAGTSKEVVSGNIERKNEILDVIADIQLVKRVLKWEPVISLEQGIENIIKYDRM